MLLLHATKKAAALAPKNVKLSLPHAVANPIETHVNGFGAFLFDGIVGNARGRAVVGLDGGRWLRMPQFFEGCSDGAGLLAVVEQPTLPIRPPRHWIRLRA